MNSISRLKNIFLSFPIVILIVLGLYSNEGISQTKKRTLASKATSVNPAETVADLTVTCPDDGTKLSKIFLCGSLANRQISTSFTNVSSVNWEKLNESSCAAGVNSDCPNKSNSCTWNQVLTGANFTVNTSGQYRIKVTYTDNSQSYYYFNVYQNALDIPVSITDIYCGKPGEVSLAQLTGYEYSLDGTTYQKFNTFSIATAGAYTVKVRRENATPTDCVFEIPVTIANKELDVVTTVTQPINYGDKGTIKLIATNVRAQYYYKITKGSTIINEVGPILESEYSFHNLNAGTYTWSVKTDDCNWKSGDVTFNSISPFQITKKIQPVSCVAGNVSLTVTGGTAPYKYYLNGNTTAELSNTISIPIAGTYSIKVVDSNNQYDTFSVDVPNQPAPVYTIEKVNENCYYPNAWQIKFNVTNKNGNNLKYSIDNGQTFATNPLFLNLSAGVYKTVVEYSFGTLKCIKTEDITIVQPQFGLSAVAGISELIGCLPSPNEDKAKVRITNPQGGTAPYQYSFDNQLNWVDQNFAFKTSGSYIFYIKDVNGCTTALPKLLIDNIGVPEIIIKNNTFNCDGSATSTIEISNNTSTKFSYKYYLDGVVQTTAAFSNVPSGNHALKVEYTPLIFPEYSNLLKEDFGYGLDTTSPGMNSSYCFEKQIPKTCGPNAYINDGEYAVTSQLQFLSAPGAWYNVKDHTFSLVTPPPPKGRFLAVNVLGNNSRPILYEKKINDIIPNQPITVEFYATNLLKKSFSGGAGPNLHVSLVDENNNVISFFETGTIGKTENWVLYSTKLDPKNNTSLKFIIRSIETATGGNDLAIDDISAYQIPKLCTTSKIVNFVIPTGKAFDASIISSKNCTCAGLSNGEITIAAQNFNTATGYQYSKDNGANWQTVTTSPFTITGLGATNYNIKVRYDASATGVCVKTFPSTAITVPQPLKAQATITTTATCSRGATITASLTGGTQFYTYELWDELSTTKARSAQNTGIFDNVTPGKYAVKGIDANGCSTTASITVAAPSLPLVSLISSPDKCYDSVNQATLQADVDSGTGTPPFAYSLNDGALQNPNSFTNIIPGDYTIKVTDSNSCVGITQKITIGKELKATATLIKALDCSSKPDATIKVTIDGGVRPIRYQILKGNTIISSADSNLPAGDTSFTYTITEDNTASYSFNIIDANGCTKTTNTVVVSAKTTPKISSITQLQSILCHGFSTAAIKVTLDTSKGVAPFTYSVKNTTTNTNYDNTFSGLPAGNYEVTVTDSNSCTSDKTNTTINEPDEIKVTHRSVDITCGDLGVSKGSVIIDKVIGGIPVYNYFVTGVNGYNNSELNNTGTKSYKFDVVDFGLYQINVVDSNGCSVLKQDVKVASPPEDLNIDVSTQTVNCSTGGTAVVSVSKANAFSSDGPFYFAIYKPGLTYTVGNPSWQQADVNKSTTFTGLLPGVQYTFIVYDNDTGCYHYKTAVAAIPTNSTLEISSLTYKNISCKGSADGKVSFTIKNNYSTATPISYQVYNSQSLVPVALVSGTITISAKSSSVVTNLGNLPFGNYFILVKEAAGATNVGCSIASATFNITESAIDLNVSASVIKNVNCNENGVISVQAKDGTAPYQYQISTVNGATSSPIGTGLIPPPPPSSVGVWGTSNTFTVNQDGKYTVFVKDAYGCEKSTVVNVFKDEEPVINLSLLDQCVNEGQFEIQIKQTTAGISPYYLSVNGSVFNLTKLPAYLLNQNSGAYSITIKDANGCTNTQTKIIYSPLELSSKVLQFPTCNTFDGSILAIASGGSGSYDYAILGSAIANGATFSGLNDGSHDLKITDKTTACQKTISLNLDSPTPVTGMSLIQKAVSCQGGSDGSITVTIATPATGINDNPIYTYSIDGETPQTSNIFTGLSAGIYTVKVISGRNCVESAQIVVAEPDAIVVSAPKVVEFGCSSTNNLNNASIAVETVIGGSGTYTQYEFIRNGTQVQFGPNPIYIEADLVGGSYTINVYDDKGCVGATTASVQPFYTLDKINLTITSPISCNTSEEIQLSAIAFGGSASNIEYSINPISGSLTGTTIPSNSTGRFNGLTVGEYLITALNTITNCSLQLVHTVNEPNTFEISIDSVVDVSCYGASTGSATITLFDQITPSRAATFSYTVLDSLGKLVLYDTTSTVGPIRIPNLKADIYTITASLINAPFCSVTKKFTISQPTAVLNLAESHSDITCVVGNNDGKITALVTGGWSNFYEYKWEKEGALIQDWGDIAELTDLTHGNFKIYVRDAKGCEINQTVQMAFPSPIYFTAGSDKAVLSCYNDQTATISISEITGGEGVNYWYTLNKTAPNILTLGPQTSNEFKNLGVGTYTVTVIDNWSCVAQSGVIQIKEPDNVVPTLVLKTAPTCMVAAKLELSIVGGTSPYTISSDNINYSPFSTTILNGNTGTNHYYIKDNNGCGSYLSNDIVVETPKTLSVVLDKTLAKINCKGESTATIFATAQGGLGNYFYSLLDDSNNVIAPAQLIGTFSNLPAGKYKVRVTSTDCVLEDSEIITIWEPTTKLSPSYFVSDVLCSGSNTGKINIATAGGTTIIKQAISPNLSQFTDTSLFDNLSMGDYEVIVQDALGCYDKKTLAVKEPSPLEAKIISTSIIQELCFDDKSAQFSIEVSGGKLPYSIALDNRIGPFETGSLTQTQFEFTNLIGGSHTVYIQDANKCVVDFKVELNEAVKLNPSTIVNYDCVSNAQHNLVTVNLDSSITDFSQVQFSLNGGIYQPSNVFSNLSPGDHFIRVKHKNGCIKDSPIFNIKKVDPLTLILKEGGLNEIIAEAKGGGGNYTYSFDGKLFETNQSYIYYKTQDYLVTVQDTNGCIASVTQQFNYIDICTPNYFTPNGDGLNDTWAPGCTIYFKNLTFTVLDRYGRELGTYNLGESWDGKYQGVELPSGDYWYVLQLNNSKDDREFVGHFTLYR